MVFEWRSQKTHKVTTLGGFATMVELDNLEALRATLAKTIASLPAVLRSCSVETLVNDIAPIFHDDDYNR